MGMKHLLIALLVFAMAPFAQAQTAKVIKVKGQQAIVQFPSGTVPQVGQQMNVGPGAVADSSGEPVAGMGSRGNLIGLGLNQLYFLSNSQTSGASTSKSRTGIKLNGRYGWNSGRMEYGPIATLEYESSDNSSVRVMAIGGFFDYNFTPNVSGVKSIYFAGADLSFGQEGTKIGPSDTTSTVIKGFVGGGIKWFGISDNFALRGEAGFYMDRSTPDSNNTVTNAGAMLRAGIANYF